MLCVCCTSIDSTSGAGSPRSAKLSSLRPWGHALATARDNGGVTHNVTYLRQT